MKKLFTIFIIFVIFNIITINIGKDLKVEKLIEKSPQIIQPIVAPTITPINSGDVIGKIVIDKINLELPIIEEANEENLKIGATHVLYTPLPWEKGNCFIAAHRSWTYGRNFNRLDELQSGDIIKIITKKIFTEKIFTYKVITKEIVEPENKEVFNRKYDLTLTTCTPLYTPTHRLLVYCLHFQ